MHEPDCYRRLAAALDDAQVLLNIIALLPFGVQMSQPIPRRLVDRIPAQRRPVDLWPIPRPTPQGVPARPRIQPRRRTP